jgi:hypothetical protein
LKQIPINFTIWNENATEMMEGLGCSQELLSEQFAIIAAEYGDACREGKIKTFEDMLAIFQKHEFYPQFLIASGLLYFLQNYMLAVDYINNGEEEQNDDNTGSN